MAIERHHCYCLRIRCLDKEYVPQDNKIKAMISIDDETACIDVRNQAVITPRDVLEC